MNAGSAAPRMEVAQNEKFFVLDAVNLSIFVVCPVSMTLKVLELFRNYIFIIVSKFV